MIQFACKVLYTLGAVVSWKLTEHSKSQIWFEDRLVPQWVSVRSTPDTDLGPENIARANKIKLRFTIRYSERDPDIICNIGERHSIYCTSITWSGVIDQAKMASLDLDAIGRQAYEEWLDSPVFGLLVNEARISGDSRTWTKNAASVGRDHELGEVAYLYLQAPTRGTKNVQDAMGYGSRATASLRVKEARAQSLIPPAGASEQENSEALARLMKERKQ